MVALSIIATTLLTLSTARAEHSTSGAAGYVNKRSCPGSEIDAGRVGKSGRWHLFYSPERGGTNCLYVDNLTRKRTFTSANLWGDTAGGHHWAWDRGDYVEYAGSVRVYNVAGKCVGLTAMVGTDKVSAGPFHCK